MIYMFNIQNKKKPAIVNSNYWKFIHCYPNRHKQKTNYFTGGEQNT